MPYIEMVDRNRINNGEEAKTPGELNYIISIAVDSYLHKKGVNYTNINEVIGVLECAKLELYRRIAAKYEDEKIIENSDVYSEF